jgi:hypothetical protein
LVREAEWNCARVGPGAAVILCKAFEWAVVVVALGAIAMCAFSIRRHERGWSVLACVGAIATLLLAMAFV